MKRFYWIAFIIILMDTSVSHTRDKEYAAISMSSIPATATFYPDHDNFARAENAIDGNKQKDNSGGGAEYRNCASTRIENRKLPLRYLRIDLQQIYYVSEVTLHLRDNHGTNRRFWQLGLTVELTNLSNAAEGLRCGGHYRISSQQSPTFPCSEVARYILITLRNSHNPLQICEVEAFGEVRGCKEPVLHNGKYSSSAGNGIGLQATFTCNIGHKIQGAESAICQGTGQWSKELPLCQPIKCRDPGPLRNGFYSFVDNQKTFGSEVVFECNANYHLKAYCKVSDPANGYVTLSPHLKKSRLPLGTYVTYKCLESDGYLVNGISKSIPLRCTGPGQWSKPIPTCSLASCDPPENPVNGACTATATTFGNSKTCSCNHGYRLRDPSLATTTCILKDSKAQWNGSTPSCQLILCHNLSKSSILHGTIIFNGRRHGNTTEYKCNDGYELIGDLKRKCQENEAWTGSTPTCKIKKCKGLPHPKHGSVSSNENRPYGSTVSYTCEPRYQLRYGSSVRKCLSTGQWNGTQPICQEMFDCSKCHEDAYCIQNSYCHCKLGFVGNGNYCCSEDMGSQVTLTGSTALFRCDSSCNIPYDRVTWLKDGILISSLPKRYGLANDGVLLYLENVTSHDSGHYSCLAHFSGTTVKRYGTLEVVESNVLSSCSLDCGKSCSKKPFVSEGALTRAGQYPWQAMLCSPYFRGQYCGGVLVSPDCIVTAAHCVLHQGLHVQNITTCLGRLCGNCSEYDSQGNPQCFKPYRVHVHPQFDRKTLDNDIAVMKLRQPANLNCASVLPVCLPDETRDAPYIGARKEGIVTGWGRVNSTVSRSICLRKGRVRLTSRRVCGIKHKDPITKSMLCATDHNGACEGDSGGPLIVKNTRYGGRFVLAGIVSWGIGCGDRQKLGVYTSVLSHLDWIKNSCGIRD